MPAALCSARYRGEGTDLSKVPAFERHGSDSGSPEVQIARLSARVQQLTQHLEVRARCPLVEAGSASIHAAPAGGAAHQLLLRAAGCHWPVWCVRSTRLASACTLIWLLTVLPPSTHAPAQAHKKDYSSRRGLLAVLSQRKQLMLYLQVRPALQRGCVGVCTT